MGDDEHELLRKIEERRGDHEFMARLRRIVEEQQDVLDSLATDPKLDASQEHPR
jgi:hypothetical protein